MNEVVGHKTFRNPDGSSRHEPLYADEAAGLWARAEAGQARRAEQMPDEQAAIRAMFEAWQRLQELGWREAMYCPKDGSYFDVIEPGSTGIHRCKYYGEWPTGSYWIDGDIPSHPVLFRFPLQRNYSGITAGAEKPSQVVDSGAAGPTRTGDLLITNQGAETAETLGNQQDTPTPAPAEGAKVAQGESSTCEGVTAGLPAWNGPWEIERSAGGWVREIVDRNGAAVCYGGIDDVPAALIRAAPELYLALSVARPYVVTALSRTVAQDSPTRPSGIAAISGDLARIDAALARATARPAQTCPECGAIEVALNTPRTTYACGSSDYDQRPVSVNNVLWECGDSLKHANLPSGVDTYCENCGWPDESWPANPPCVICGQGSVGVCGDTWRCEDHWIEDATGSAP